LQNNTTTTAKTQVPATPPIATTPPRFTKRIGNTTYRVSVHFSAKSKETMNDKIMRLIRNEAESGKAVSQ
jgi:hypothetical protein